MFYLQYTILTLGAPIVWTILFIYFMIALLEHVILAVILSII